MANVQTTISPVDGKPVVVRQLPSDDELDEVVRRSVEAFRKWRLTSIDERIAIAEKFVQAFVGMCDEVGKEITLQIGRPIRYGAGEVRGTEERSRYMISAAKEALADIPCSGKPGFTRYIRKEPVGPVLVISPWNFPNLVQINAVLPAILAGNSVILKPAPQTPLSGERFKLAFEQAGLPADVIQIAHTTVPQLEKLVADPRIQFVAFTGSVENGKRVGKAAANGEGFKGVGLELGGKDPAYVRLGADLAYTAGELVDGAMFNAGQSCCAIERVYVHEKVYDEFVRKVVEVVKGYKLGDPQDPETTMGPVVSVQAAERIRKQIDDAIAAGAKSLVPTSHFPNLPTLSKAFVAPTVLTDVNHTMSVMMDETFGPVLPIMKVSSDAEALEKMNDSPYGLTASVWTKSIPSSSDDEMNVFAAQLEAGTVFFNRCDYLDPELPWAGVKDSGRGLTLSKLGFDQFMRTKGVHVKIV